MISTSTALETSFLYAFLHNFTLSVGYYLSVCLIVNNQHCTASAALLNNIGVPIDPVASVMNIADALDIRSSKTWEVATSATDMPVLTREGH